MPSIFWVMLLISGLLRNAVGGWGIDMRFLPVFRGFIFLGGVSIGDAGVVGEAQAYILEKRCRNCQRFGDGGREEGLLEWLLRTAGDLQPYFSSPVLPPIDRLCTGNIRRINDSVHRSRTLSRNRR